MACSCIQFNVDAANPLPFISSILGKGARYLAGLGKSSTGVLSDETNRLKAIKVDVEEAVRAQERKTSRKSNNQVEQWLKEAADLIDAVDRFEGSCIHRLPCLKDCPCWATDMLEHVQQLKVRGEGLKQELHEDPLRILGEEPLRTSNVVPNPQIVGRDETLKKVLGHLNSDVKIVGIHGMPGIGKTALLQNIYHKLNGGPMVVVYCPKNLTLGAYKRKSPRGLG